MNENPNKPLILVIFGITGDLSRRKLLPALYHLVKSGELSEKTCIMGISRRDVSSESIYKSLQQYIHGDDFDENIAKKLQSMTEIFQLDPQKKQDYVELRERLRIVSDELGSGVSRLYYLSIPAQVFITVVHHLGETGHHEPFGNDSERPRLLVEKPFGYDMASAKELVKAADEHFGEQQTYRIDHYLAKETAQNILTFRFKNPLFKSIWNAKHIESIQISAHETIGIEDRANFYEQTGALRDFIQSHLIQLLALVAMAEPKTLESHDIHVEKLRLLDSVRTITKRDIAELAVRGQYDTYRKEVSNPKSIVETFARLVLYIDSEQWSGVPMVLETGKGLRQKCSKISVRFRETDSSVGPNVLTFRIQPREGITLSLQAKHPGLDKETEEVEMEFDYEKSYGQTAEAYERVITDAIRGDQSLFASADEVLCSWRIIEHVLQGWSEAANDLITYPVGSLPEDILRKTSQ